MGTIKQGSSEIISPDYINNQIAFLQVVVKALRRKNGKVVLSRKDEPTVDRICKTLASYRIFLLAERIVSKGKRS